MKKLVVMLAVVLVSAVSFAQSSNSAKAKFHSLTEIFLGPEDSNTFRTGVSYQGVYLFAETVECKQDYQFAIGAAYDGSIAKTKTDYRILAKYGKEFYGFAVLMQDLGMKYISFKPTLLVDTDLFVSVGLFIPFQLTKNLSVGFWATKGIKEANRGGFRLGRNQFEVDLTLKF